MMCRGKSYQLLLCLISFFCSMNGVVVFANSYAGYNLPKEELPDSANGFTCWRAKWGVGKTKGITREAINRFLGKGEHFPMSTVFPELDQYRRMTLPFAIKVKLFKRPDELSQKELTIIDNYQKYSEIIGVTGAFTDKKGRVHLWKLLSTRHLKIDRLSSICYLVLDEKNQVELKEFPKQVQLSAIPKIPKGEFIMSRGFLPGTGGHKRILKATLRKFTDESVVFDLTKKSLINSSVNERSNRPEGFQINSSGDFQRNRVNAVFVDIDNGLWSTQQILNNCLHVFGPDGEVGYLVVPSKLNDKK